MTTDQEQLTWEQVLERDDIIGGDVETVENGVPYRSPISRVEIDGEMVRFYGPWTAMLDLDTGKWKTGGLSSFSVNKEYAPPQDIGQGRIFFSIFMLGHATIFPKGGSNLDPAKVEGLVFDEASGEYHPQTKEAT